MNLELNDYELIVLSQLMEISAELDKQDKLFDKSMDDDSKLLAVTSMMSLSAKLYKLSEKRLKEVEKETAVDAEIIEEKE